jgi:hypothetical protein
MFRFNLQRFGGKGGYQSAPAIITELSPEQKRTIALQNQYLEATAPVLSDLVNKGSTALNAYSAPDFSKYYQQGLDTTLDASNNARMLAQGRLPSAYQANVSQAVADAVSPYQQQFTRMGSSGTINSSLMRGLTTDMARGATAAANNAINQNLASASNLNQAYGQSATAPLGYQSTYYQTQTQPAKDFLTLGTSTYQPTGAAANQAYQWQAALSAPAQNNYIQQPGLGSVFGTVLGGLAGNPGLFGKK